MDFFSEVTPAKSARKRTIHEPMKMSISSFNYKLDDEESRKSEKKMKKEKKKREKMEK